VRRRAGLTPALVVEEAARLADEVGLDRLTLAAVAQRLGVALPSLYKHIRGLDALVQQLACVSTAQLAGLLADAAAGRAGVDALRSLADAYRSYAREHPGRSAAAQRVPDPADPAHVAAGERVLGVIYAVLRSYGLEGDALVDATRGLRAALHGFATLELGGGFGLPRDIDRSYAQLVTALDHALRSWPR
jgi:AcrR family transcriptional regulator